MIEHDKFQPPYLEPVRRAAQQLVGVARKTPLLQSSFDSGLYLKAENLQVTGSFKIRAAYPQVANLSQEALDKGLVTSSSGNFAQAAAFAATRAGASIKVVMMESSNPLKVERARCFGAEVVFCENRNEARWIGVDKIIAAEGRTSIHPYDSPEAIAGNGTVSLEIFEDLPWVRRIVAPVSGGGLLAGIAVAAKELNPEIEVIGVQPRGSNATYLSFQARSPQQIERANTMADGLTTTRPGKLTFPLVLKYVDAIHQVEEDAIFAAVRHCLMQERLVVEPSGCVPLAAVLEGKVPCEGTVVVLSGGNINPEMLLKAARPE